MRPEMRYSDTRWSGWGEQLPYYRQRLALHAAYGNVNTNTLSDNVGINTNVGMSIYAI